MAGMLKRVSPVYVLQWLASGFAMSEDLSLISGEFFPAEKETAAGAVQTRPLG